MVFTGFYINHILLKGAVFSLLETHTKIFRTSCCVYTRSYPEPVSIYDKYYIDWNYSGTAPLGFRLLQVVTILANKQRYSSSSYHPRARMWPKRNEISSGLRLALLDHSLIFLSARYHYSPNSWQPHMVQHKRVSGSGGVVPWWKCPAGHSSCYPDCSSLCFNSLVWLCRKALVNAGSGRDFFDSTIFPKTNSCVLQTICSGLLKRKAVCTV